MPLGQRADLRDQFGGQVAAFDGLAILWTVAHLAPPSVGIFQARILKWIVIASSRDLSDPGIELVSPASPALADGFFTTKAPGEPAGDTE